MTASHASDGQQLQAPDCYRVGYVAPALAGTNIGIHCWMADPSQVACRISDDSGTELARALVSRRG